MKNAVVWAIMLCTSESGSRFGGTYHPHHHIRRVIRTRNRHKVSESLPEDGGDIFLRNSGSLGATRYYNPECRTFNSDSS
jgi:hypothetical protein